MAKNTKKRKVKQSPTNNSNTKSGDANSAANKKKRLSWAKELCSFQTEELTSDMNDTKASVSLATELLTSTPKKSALAAKYRKQKSIEVVVQTSTFTDTQTTVATTGNENNPPNKQKVLLKEGRSTTIKLAQVVDEEKPAASGKKKLKKKIKSVKTVVTTEQVLSEVNGLQAPDFKMVNEGGDTKLSKKSAQDGAVEKMDTGDLVEKPELQRKTDGKAIFTKKQRDPKRTLFIGNIAYEVSEEELSNFLQVKVGAVENVQILKNKESKKPRGIWALELLQGAAIGGRELRFKKTFKKKKLRQLASAAANHSTISKNQLAQRKQKSDQHIRQRLSNYIISKKTFNNAVSDRIVLSKKAVKDMQKRKTKKIKKKTLL
ncbi:hypothetical protein M3Y97_00688600 [Aphelenchoides bicaudatus]|nr:hypothetical protein M3Y97_00688600 [Aphelenchoides bicaudatus]